MSSPSFTIVIPTYQRRDIVCDAVRALCNVDYDAGMEVVVVVDGSTDGTAAALAQLQCPFPLRVIEQQNRGLAHARNRGAAEAKGDILLFLDDDMMCEPDVLEQHASSYEDGADAVVGDFPVAPGSRPGFLSDSISARKVWERGEIIRSPFAVFGGHISVRRSAFERIGGFDEQFTEDGTYGNEDIDFGQRLLKEFRVRRNPRAISHQLSLVGPREYMRRARDCADADVLFARKHPELAKDLYEQRGGFAMSNRLRRLSGLPILPRLFAEFATFTAEVGLLTPLRSNRKLAWLFQAGYLLTYWSSVKRRGGIPLG